MKIKKLLSLLAAAAMTVTAITGAMSASVVSAEETPTSGKCGENVTWSFDETTGVLTISGTGDMYTKYVPYDQWGYYQYKDEITEVVVEEGITYISECAFGPFDDGFTLYREPPIYSKLIKLTLPSSVKSIGNFAFYKTALKSVTLPEGLEEIGDAAFSFTPLSGDFNLPKSLNNLGQNAFSNTNISSVILNEGMILGGCAFCNCDSLKEVTIPSGLTYGLTGTSNAGRPNCGFAQCDSLEKVVIQGEGTVARSYNTPLENGLGEMLFSQCPSLKEVELETEDIEYVSSDTFDMTNNPTFKVYKGSTTEQTLKDAGYLTSENTKYYDVDVSELKKAISKAKDIDTSKFTDESVSQLEKALTGAQALLEKESYLPSEVNTVLETLNNAISALTVKYTEQNNEKPADKTTAPTNVKTKSQQNAEAAMKQAKITKLTVKSKAKKKITVTWKKVSKAKGYQVQVSTNKKFKKNKIILTKNTKNKKLVIKKLKSKKTYFVRVRAYATYKDSKGATKKAYSAWNKKVRKVKVK